MKRILEDVVPVGTPWGGPESMKNLSCFTSMLMRMENALGSENDLQRKHEWFYNVYLAITGVGVTTRWSERYPELCADALDRAMAYAGYRFRVVDRPEITGTPDTVRQAIVSSIDREIPVLADSGPGAWNYGPGAWDAATGDWSIICGYDDEGDALIGWDGSQGYWGAPPVIPDGYLENGMFFTKNWPATVHRFVQVTGRTEPRNTTSDVLVHLISVMEQQLQMDKGNKYQQWLEDDTYCQSADPARIGALWRHLHGIIGFYAEARCFTSGVFTDSRTETYPIIRYVPGDHVETAHADTDQQTPGAVERDAIRHAFRYLTESHDLSWDAWKALYATHRCGCGEEARCGQCGVCCLQAPTEEDYVRFRLPAPRRKLMGLLQTLIDNDVKTLEELRKCVASL